MPEQALPLDVGDEPLIGWRCWHVLPHEGLLRPIYKRGLVWKPRQPLEAICPEEPHEVPADHCKCGVWTVCHPMLLDEVGWTKAPPAGTAKLPGVIVVGEVSLWGKIIQHERGWRASCAYPRHLYAFTEDAMLAETLRERYGVPVEWGANTERLRRMLPREANRDEGPSLRETLLDVLRTGLCPKPLEELAATALDELGDLLQPPEKRIEAARASLAKATTATERTKLGWRLAIAVADQRALKGNTTAARRALWMRLARWQRHRSDELFEKKVEWCLRERDGLLEDLARGSIAKGGATLASPTCRRRSRASGLGLRTSTGTSRPPSFPRSRRSRLCRSRAIGNGARSRRASWWARGGRSRKRARPSRRGCAEHSSENGPSPRSTASSPSGAISSTSTRRPWPENRRSLNATGRPCAIPSSPVSSGTTPSYSVRSPTSRRRRRAALAMLPGPWPPSNLRPRTAGGQRPATDGVGAIAASLRERGITQQRVAEEANVSRSLVSHVLAGRAQSKNVVEAAERLLSQPRSK